jgi:hypothetical protein
MYSLQPWLVLWEQAITRDLLIGSDQQNYFAKYNVDALLRGDLVSRYTAHGIAIEKGFKTRNEVRANENLNPLEGLDVPLVPLNMGDGSEPPSSATAPGAARMEFFVRMAADRLAAKELTSVRRAVAKLAQRNGHASAADHDVFERWTRDFYDGFALDISDGLIIPHAPAKEFATCACEQLLASNGDRAQLLNQWERSRIAAFTELGLNRGRTTW